VGFGSVDFSLALLSTGLLVAAPASRRLRCLPV